MLRKLHTKLVCLAGAAFAFSTKKGSIQKGFLSVCHHAFLLCISLVVPIGAVIWSTRPSPVVWPLSTGRPARTPVACGRFAGLLGKLGLAARRCWFTASTATFAARCPIRAACSNYRLFGPRSQEVAFVRLRSVTAMLGGQSSAPKAAGTEIARAPLHF